MNRPPDKPAVATVPSTGGRRARAFPDASKSISETVSALSPPTTARVYYVALSRTVSIESPIFVMLKNCGWLMVDVVVAADAPLFFTQLLLPLMMMMIIIYFAPSLGPLRYCEHV